MFQKTLELLFKRLGTPAVLITNSSPGFDVVVVSTPEELPDIDPDARRRAQFLKYDVLQSQYPTPALDDVLKIGENFHQIASFSSPDAENLIWTLEVERYRGQAQI